MRYFMIPAVLAMVLVTSVGAEPPADMYLKKLAVGIGKFCPEAKIESAEKNLVAKQGTMVLTIHGVGKNGAISEKPQPEEGPGHKGFMLSVSYGDKDMPLQADVPQTLQGPYFPTYLTTAPAADPKHFWFVRLSYGKQLDPKIKDGLFALMEFPDGLEAMVGKKAAEVEKANNLDKYKAWPTPNLPMDSDMETTYFMATGDLHFFTSGGGPDSSPIIKRAVFYSSDLSADQRVKAVYKGWQVWVDAHTPKRADLRPGGVPIGSLGHPLGTYLTLEGKRVANERLKVSDGAMNVEKINGIALDKPIMIEIANLKLPKDQTCVIKGYENAHMIGAPDAYVQAMKEEGKDAPMPQAGWQVHFEFCALRVLAPADLKINQRN